MADLRIQIQAWRSGPPPRIRRTPPTPPRLADVVRGSECNAAALRTQFVVYQLLRPTSARPTGSSRVPENQPLPQCSTALPPCDRVRLPFHQFRHPPRDRCLVATRFDRPLLSRAVVTQTTR